MNTNNYIETQDVTQYLTDLWKNMLGKEAHPDADFFDLGGDSMTSVRMIMRIQSTLNVEIDLEKFLENPRLNNLIAMITNTRH